MQDRGLTARVVAGEAFGARSPVQTASPTLYVELRLAQGAALPLDACATDRALFLLSGDVELDGRRFEPGPLLSLRPGTTPTLRALSAAHLVLIGGEPLEGARYLWWNLVSSRPERIEAAKADWKHHRFDLIEGDSDESIPLPEDPPGARIPPHTPRPKP